MVAEAGKISEAARRLHLSQPAITSQIRRLEAELDTALFIRSVHGVTLTPRGAHLRERLQHVFADLEEAMSELDQPEELDGSLEICRQHDQCGPFRPKHLRSISSFPSAVGLHLIVGNAKDVLDHVREQRVALGLMAGHERSPGVRLEEFMPDEIVAVCPPRIRDPKFRRAIQNLKSARDLERLPLIWRERGAGTRAMVEQVLKKHGLNVRKLDQRIEIGSTEAIKALVIAEIGIAFFSCWEIQDELAAGTLREIKIPGLQIYRKFSWALPVATWAAFPASSIDSPIRSDPSSPP